MPSIGCVVWFPYLLILHGVSHMTAMPASVQQ